MINEIIYFSQKQVLNLFMINKANITGQDNRQ